MKFLILFALINLCVCDYWSDREQMLNDEASYKLGSTIGLSDKAIEVNNKLMEWKAQEMKDGIANPSQFPPAVHFFQSKEMIENSKVFQFIKSFPKGGSLHSHSSAMASFDWIYNQTYREDLYACVPKADEPLALNFFFNNKTDSNCDNWQLVSELRQNDDKFDDYLKSQMSLVVDDPRKAYPDSVAVWKAFNRCFETIGDFLYYVPVFKDYVRQVIQEFYDDNVIYLEIRGGFGWLYDADGKTYGPSDMIKVYLDAVAEFQKDQPDFLGIKFIYAKSRRVDDSALRTYIQQMLELKALFPDFILGFDLVGQEDLGRPLKDLAPILLEYENVTQYFFHSGETNWYEEDVDRNLIDAVLLNTTRIGHGFAVVKHPRVLEIIKHRQTAIELNPISNQVLNLVDDLRNHPGAFLLSQDYTVVITCDDPTFWGGKGLSYDWYMAFMGMAGSDGDLKMLTELAIDSLRNSGVESVDEKLDMLTKWSDLYNDFIDKFEV